MAGLSTPRIVGKLALRASVTGEVVMADVFVPEAQLLPGVAGLKGPFGLSQYGPLWHRLGRTGCRRNLLAYRAGLHHGAQPVRSPAGGQPTGAVKAGGYADRHQPGAAGLLPRGAVAGRGQIAPELISLIKRNSCGKALAIARQARDMLGANGISDEYPVMRHMVNLEVVNTYEGTHDIHALILGRTQTDIPAF